MSRPSPGGNPPPSDVVTVRQQGATHGAEAAYVFENLRRQPAVEDLDRKLADTISSYWVNFAANGNPNGKGLPSWPLSTRRRTSGWCWATRSSPARI